MPLLLIPWQMSLLPLFSIVSFDLQFKSDTMQMNAILWLHIFRSEFYLFCLAPGKPEVFLELLEGNTIRISWKLDRKNGVILAYNLTYTRMDNPQDTQSIKTTNTTLILSGLQPGKRYSFVVSYFTR